MYPKPFSSTISGDVPNDVQVTIEDMFGRMVQDISAPLHSRGEAMVGGDLASGVYWCRVKGGVARMLVRVK